MQRKTGLLQWPPRKQELSAWMFKFKLFPQTQFAGKNAKYNNHPTFVYVQGLSHKLQGASPLLYGFWFPRLLPLSLSCGPQGAWPMIVLNWTTLNGGTAVSGPYIKSTVLCLGKASLRYFLSCSFHCHLCLLQISFKISITFLWSGFLTIPNYVLGLGNPRAGSQEHPDASLIHFFRS